MASPPDRVAFVLSGGAGLGAIQVGMLRALYEHGIVPELIVGTSAGAINGAFVASRPQTVAAVDDLTDVHLLEALMLDVPGDERSAADSWNPSLPGTARRPH